MGFESGEMDDTLVFRNNYQLIQSSALVISAWLNLFYAARHSDSLATTIMHLPDWFVSLNPILQALLAGGLTWVTTAIGAAIVVFAKEVNRTFLDAMLGFAAGIM